MGREPVQVRANRSMRTLDFETDEDIARIELIVAIVQSNQMSERIELLKNYEKSHCAHRQDVQTCV